jgi:carbon monoxide dehydrogenase subunit G
MRFEGEFRIPGRAEEVLGALEDVERMVKCMPGAGIEGRDQDGNYLGSMVVAFGPKKIKFKGKVKSTVDPAAGRGSLHVRGAAEMRTAAPAEVHVNYTVPPDPAATTPTSVVSLVSEAELGGVCADLRGLAANAVTQALMEMVLAARLAENSAASSLLAAPKSSAKPLRQSYKPHRLAAGGGAPRPGRLSAGRLFWLVVKARLSALAGWMRSKLHPRS